MTWDKDLPDGSVSIAQGDDVIRDNNAAIEAALDLEHQFATGGLVTGRHKFLSADLAAQDALGVDSDDDSWIILRTDVRGNRCWFYYDGTAGEWKPIDLGTDDVPRLDEASEFTQVQWSKWDQVVPSGATLAVDFEKSATQYAAVPASSLLTISNPINLKASYGASVTIQLTNAGSGATLAWGTDYKFVGGVSPIFDATSGALNVYNLTVLQTGKTFVSGAAGIA